LNGKVERSHHVDDQEFYHLLDKNGISDDIRLFNKKLREWEISMAVPAVWLAGSRQVNPPYPQFRQPRDGLLPSSRLLFTDAHCAKRDMLPPALSRMLTAALRTSRLLEENASSTGAE